MKYISNMLYMVGIIAAVIGIISLCFGCVDFLITIRLMTGGVIAMGAGHILTECCDWWEEVRYDL